MADFGTTVTTSSTMNVNTNNKGSGASLTNVYPDGIKTFGNLQVVIRIKDDSMLLNQILSILTNLEKSSLLF